MNKKGWTGKGYFQAQVQMTSLKEQFADKPNYKPNDEKREIVIPLLIEGWGNTVDNNYYTAKAVTESASLLMARRKMYLNHPKSETDARDMKDWAGSIQETWVDKTADGRTVALGRVKIYDNWLWERAKAAPEEIADSLMGKGRARKGTVGDREGNIIEGIEFVNSCDFVDYGGNVPFGMAYFVENDKQETIKEEDKEMLITEITLSMLKESRPELITEVEKTVIEEKDKKIAELDTKIKEQEKANTDLKNQLDSFSVKEKIALKKATIAKLLKESKLPEAAQTELFAGILMACEESKKIVEGKEVVVTVEEQVKSLIEDRSAILGIKNPVTNMGGTEDKNKVEAGDQTSFNEGILGIKEEKKEEQK